MKKLISIVLVAVAMLAAPAANAQLRFGAKVGANFSNVTFDNIKKFDFKGATLANFTGGITAEWLFIAGFGIDASVMYTAKGSKYEGDFLETLLPELKGKDAVAENIIHYIEVPINLKYKLCIKGIENIIAPFIYAGPSFAFKVGDKFKLSGDDSAFETTKNLFENKGFDVALNVGLGVEVIKHIDVAVQYGWGLGVASDIKGIGNITDAFQAKTGVWTVTVGYMF